MGSVSKQMKSLNMKKLLFCAVAFTGLVAASLRAGTETYKQVAPPPPPPMYGLGFYGALELGANVYQNLPGSRTFTQDNPNFPGFGDTLDVSPQHNVGFWGGLKFGYVFNPTGWVVRPTVELDSFYNGFNTDTNFTLRDPNGDVLRSSSSSNRLNSGVWLFNFILRLGPPTWQFQPYVGAGPGVYYAEGAGFSFTGPNGELFNTGGGRNHADFAFDVVAGADYFFTPKLSAFVEYKFLEYTSSQVNTSRSRTLGQQLVGAGVRYFFWP
jgi:opacity protein-like surface antigen